MFHDVCVLIFGVCIGMFTLNEMLKEEKMTGREFIRKERLKKECGKSKLSHSELDVLEESIIERGLYFEKAKYSIVEEKKYALRIER